MPVTTTFRMGLIAAVALILLTTYGALWHKDTIRAQFENVSANAPSWWHGPAQDDSQDRMSSPSLAEEDSRPTAESQLETDIGFNNDTSAALPPAVPEKMVVLAHLEQEDTSWVINELPDWHNAMYVVDNTSAPLHMPKNKGREAGAYLLYIIQNYEALPEVIAFIHPHKDGYPQAWHNDNDAYSNVVSLNQLNLKFVKESGYTNLRCIGVPGCPNEVDFTRNPEDANVMEQHFPEVWPLFFPGTEMPDVVGSPCCAQFAVSGQQIAQRPKNDYERMYKWLMETPIEDGDSGRVFEYLWHIIFGREAVYCRDLNQCYCETYGRC